MTCIFENNCVIYITVLDSQREPESDAVMATLLLLFTVDLFKVPLSYCYNWGIVCTSILILYACL